MAFANDKERSAAIRDFLEQVAFGRLAGLWTYDGPTSTAADYIKNGSPLSHGEHILLQVAFDIWNGRGKATIADLVEVLDDDNLGATLRLIETARPGAAR